MSQLYAHPTEHEQPTIVDDSEHARFSSPETPPHLRGHPSMPGIGYSPRAAPVDAQAGRSGHAQAPSIDFDPSMALPMELRTADDVDRYLSEKLGKGTAEKTPARRPRSGCVFAWAGRVDWWHVLRFSATYMVLPFVTGVMAGMGEIFANELMFRWGWRGARPARVPGRNGRVFPAAAEEAKGIPID